MCTIVYTYVCNSMYIHTCREGMHAPITYNIKGARKRARSHSTHRAHTHTAQARQTSAIFVAFSGASSARERCCQSASPRSSALVPGSLSARSTPSTCSRVLRACFAHSGFVIPSRRREAAESDVRHPSGRIPASAPIFARAKRWNWMSATQKRATTLNYYAQRSASAPLGVIKSCGTPSAAPARTTRAMPGRRGATGCHAIGATRCAAIRTGSLAPSRRA
jgi:hypothetical protein